MLSQTPWTLLILTNLLLFQHGLFPAEVQQQMSLMDEGGGGSPEDHTHHVYNIVILSRSEAFREVRMF